MIITHIHSYLVKAEKGEERLSSISGTTLGHSGQMFALLRKIFDEAPEECEQEIMFTPALDGTQQNDCRDEVITYIENPTLPNGRHLARRLQAVTTRRSGLGLLFLILGGQGRNRRLVISRFPADNGILAEAQSGSLTIQFVEQIFMKNAKSYKAALYEGDSTDEDFWIGNAVDKQLNGDSDIREYWIKDFLISDFSTTPERGTRAVSIALKEIHNDPGTPARVREEISAAVRLSGGLNQQSFTPVALLHRLNLSGAAQTAVLSKIPTTLHQQNFRFDTSEMEKYIAFKVVELDSGAHLSAMATQFDNVFRRTEGDNGQIQFSTSGNVIEETIRKRK